MRYNKPATLISVGACGAVLLLAGLVWVRPFLRSDEDILRRAIAALEATDKSQGTLTVQCPLKDTLYPCDIAPPRMQWERGDQRIDRWVVRVTLPGPSASVSALTREPVWQPGEDEWRSILKHVGAPPVRLDVAGIARRAPHRVLARASIYFAISPDPVAAPIFYRDVNLPFIDAVKDPSTIRWRMGTVSSPEPPRTVLDGLPVCANCHSFSAGGDVLGMDVDYANDKGSYAIVPIERTIELTKDKVITWSDYRREDNVTTFGLLSQVSPDGRYVVSTVKDRSVFVPKPGIAFSQLFFPIQGILVIYDRQTGTMQALPGADDPAYVQSNPCWSPDGTEIVFARSKAFTLERATGGDVLLSRDECAEFLRDGKPFAFDLYRIPVNDGRGGEALPVEGASGNGMSNYFARYSPDSKWIVFCRSKNYMLLQPDSELWIIPAEGGIARRLDCNTTLMNSWHSWSPNARWLVFASKRDTPYTQLFLTHIDELGRSSPAVFLWQFAAHERAANIPEFVNPLGGGIDRMKAYFVDDFSLYRAGLEFNRAGDYEGAIATFMQALELNPDNPDAHYNLALVLAKTGRTEEAIRHYREATRCRSDWAQPWNNLGGIYLTLGEDTEAEKCYRRAIALDAKLPQPQYNLARLLRKQGDIREAARRFRTVTDLLPEHSMGYMALASVYDGSCGKQWENLDEAVAVLQQAAAVTKRKDPVVLRALAAVYARQGQIQSATSVALEAVALARSAGDSALEQAILRDQDRWASGR